MDRALFSDRLPAARFLGLLAAAVVSCGLVQPRLACGQSAGELRTGARQIGADISAQKSAGRFDAPGQRAAIERLGKLVLQFIDVSDRVANTGAEGRERDALQGAYQALSQPLEGVYNENSSRLDRMTKQVMDEDGDLEALYETQPFKDAQVVASQSLYFLNWLHYYGTRLYDGAARKDLLEKAQHGFSEFAVGDRHSDLLVESLLGRGLCHLELGNTEFAIHDLQAVANDPQASPERKIKARLAILDADVRAGNVGDALKVSDALLGGGGHPEDNLVRFLRIRALLAGAKSASGADADRYRQQALALMDQLRRAGGGWEEKVSALAATSIDNPEKWSDKATSAFARWELAKLLVQKGEYKQAMPLLESFVTSNDAEMRRHQGEALYFLGLAKFQAGQYAAAAAHLEGALKDTNPSYGADAAYMRFKALEAVVAKTATTDAGGLYEHAIDDYLAKYPEHKSAFEARFRLGELRQAQHRFDEALQSYAKVRGDPAFELRAQFAGLQCDFELLQGNDQRVSGSRRDAVLTDIGAGLQRFDRQAAELDGRKAAPDQVPLNEMGAKVAIMTAVYLNLQPEPNDAAVADALARFEQKYPEQTDLLPQVVRLRLAAFQRLGRFGEAEVEVKARGQLLLASAGAPALEEIAVGFIREGARRNGRGDAAANQSAQQVALRLYEQLTAERDGNAKSKLTLARLYENTGESQKAAAIYAAELQANANSPAALRGLGRIAEAEKRLSDAVGYWQRLASALRAGDAPWYEARYEVARLTHAMGKQAEACDDLQQLKPAMPGLSDADLRTKLDKL